MTDPDTDQKWTPSSLTAWIANSDLDADLGKLWDYGAEMYDASCGLCHTLPPTRNYLANQWIGNLNAMKRNISLDDEQYRFLQKYVQMHAQDMAGKDMAGKDREANMNDLPRPTSFAGLDARDLVALFNWLSAVFAAPPDRDSIASYRRGPAAAWLDGVASLPGCADAVARMRRALVVDADDAIVVARVGAAYGLLFEGIGGPKTVSPYELVYRDGGRLFGAPAAEMEAILAAHDLSVAASAHEAPDHLAVELAAAARLLEEGERDAEAIVDRLQGWVPAFAADCAAADANGFWAGAAAVLTAVVGLATRQPANAKISDATKK